MAVVPSDGVVSRATVNGVVATVAREVVIAAVVIPIEDIRLIVPANIRSPTFKFCIDPLIIDKYQSTI